MGCLIIKCAALCKCLNKLYETLFPHFLIVSGKYYFSFSSREVFRMDCCFILKWFGWGGGMGIVEIVHFNSLFKSYILLRVDHFKNETHIVSRTQWFHS